MKNMALVKSEYMIRISVFLGINILVSIANNRLIIFKHYLPIDIVMI